MGATATAQPFADVEKNWKSGASPYLTSVKSNQAKGRIAVLTPRAAADAFVRCVRWASMHIRPRRQSIAIFTTQCTHAYVRYNGRHISPWKYSFSWGICIPSNIHGSLDQKRRTPERHLDQFSGFWTAHPCAKHRQTHRHTDHATCDICSNTGRICALFAWDMAWKVGRK